MSYPPSLTSPTLHATTVHLAPKSFSIHTSLQYKLAVKETIRDKAIYDCGELLNIFGVSLPGARPACTVDARSICVDAVTDTVTKECSKTWKKLEALTAGKRSRELKMYPHMVSAYSVYPVCPGLTLIQSYRKHSSVPSSGPVPCI